MPLLDQSATPSDVVARRWFPRNRARRRVYRLRRPRCGRSDGRFCASDRMVVKVSVRTDQSSRDKRLRPVGLAMGGQRVVGVDASRRSRATPPVTRPWSRSRTSPKSSTMASVTAPVAGSRSTLRLLELLRGASRPATARRLRAPRSATRRRRRMRRTGRSMRAAVQRQRDRFGRRPDQRPIGRRDGDPQAVARRRRGRRCRRACSTMSIVSPGTTSSRKFVAVAMAEVEHAVGDAGRGAVRLHVAEPHRDHGASAGRPKASAG